MKQFSLPNIFPVTCHTDHIGPGSTFVAIKGMKEDGITYISLALQKGTTKIVVAHDALLEQEVIDKIRQQNIELVRLENPRKALAQLSAHALGYPAKKLKIIGVTGTKGKTTTCFLLEHLLKSVGYKTALLSTVHNKIDATTFKTDLTTQHPDYLHVFFNQCVKSNIDFVVMEVAAQAISLDRIYGIEFDGIIFTNFDLEHSEFYTSMDDYFAAKCQFFDHAKSETPIFINADDAWLKKKLIDRELNKRYQSLSLKDAKVDSFAKVKKNDVSGLSLKIDDIEYKCPMLFGEFNAYNILAAVSLLKQLGVSSESLVEGLLSFPGVPGRLQMYPLLNGARAFIDKAHNPSSYKAVLGTLRTMTDHLIVIFGCGGERDKTKRPLMGKIATELCDLVILTNDDPRSEDPQAIINDILVGIDQQNMKKVIREVDREKAINLAYKCSKSSSIIVLLGKGPEEYQLINGVKTYFSEREILQSLR